MRKNLFDVADLRCKADACNESVVVSADIEDELVIDDIDGAKKSMARIYRKLR